VGGICGEDMRLAVRAEYRENEVFPPSDSVEDWLKLLDYEPENVVKVLPVKPQQEKTPETRTGKVI
jgi:proteasome-associated ATPase